MDRRVPQQGAVRVAAKQAASIGTVSVATVVISVISTIPVNGARTVAREERGHAHQGEGDR